MSGNLRTLTVTSALAAVLYATGPSIVSGFAQDASNATQNTTQQTAEAKPEATQSPKDISCLTSANGAPNTAVDQFSENPQALLDRYPLGGLALSNEARTLAVRNVNSVDILLQLAAKATTQQTSAIGAGLARAVLLCVSRRPDLADQIQLKILAANNQTLTTAFLSGPIEQATASIGTGSTAGAAGAGAAGAGAGAGGIGGSGSGPGSNFPSTGVANAGGSLAGSGNGSFAAGVRAATSVSPTL